MQSPITRQRINHWIMASWPLLALMTACWLVYANSLGNEFVFDDIKMVATNKAIAKFDLARLLAIWYRPVRDMSLALDHQLWGMEPWGFRATNIFIHSLNSWLVFLLAVKVAGNRRAAFMAALLFAVHPVQTDAVAYISGRRDVLFAFFYLLSFLWWIKYREKRKLILAIGSVTCFALSIMTKEMAATLPLTILLWELFVKWDPAASMSVGGQLLERLRETLRLNRRALIAGALVLAGFVIVSVVVGLDRISPRAKRLEYWGGTAWSNFLTVLTIHAHYLKLLVWPVTLIASYQGAYPIARSVLHWRVVFSFVLMAGVVAMMIHSLKRDHIISFCLAFYLIALLPVSHIIPHHELLAEHYLYLPMFGFALLIGHLLDRLCEQGREWKWAVYSSLTIIISLFGARTVLRNRDWKDSVTLWETTYKALPNSPRAANNLGIEYIKRKQFKKAIPMLEEAIELDPRNIIAFQNLGVAYMAQRNCPQALEVMERGLTIEKSDDPAIRNLWNRSRRELLHNAAQCYLEVGDPDRAIEALEDVTHGGRGKPKNYVLLATIYEQQHQWDAAIETCRRGLARYSSSPELRQTLNRLIAGSNH